jgi:hypothetical protein
MLKKIVLGILTITIIAAGASALAYNLGKNRAATAAADEPLPAQNNLTNANGIHAASPDQQVDPQPQAEGLAGEPFTHQAQILSFDSNGMDVILETGEPAYIELGPEDYWRSSGIELRELDTVTITGSVLEDMYHVVTLTTPDGQTLVLRTDAGQPMWSGGVSNGNRQGSQDGEHTPDPQASVDEWITLTGTLTAIANGQMTIQLADGQLVSFQTGQPRFFQSQGVTFNLGEQVEVVGFYTDGSFSAGDITQLSTGIRVFLRDPNGRPLWAGPGNGNGAGNGSTPTN